ncbi:cation:proton antiporter [Balneola sp. MJW-20]|uniref:cation:proton antiporter n=1 Tax=Gracilimonas aurantiaca TaxID=3234185 RepID=UPI0034653313
MSEYILIGLASVIALGISAQWIAWKFKLPAILMLLGFGIVAGPVTGLLDPDKLMGDILTPFVSISVAIILFEGGLSLRMSEFRQIGGVVIKLITIGILITWTLAAYFAWLFLDLGLELSILFGAVLIVTGPTVIIPLLRQVRPTERAGSVLKWEGIVNDPIGAMMAVFVFEIILAGGFANISGKAGLIIVATIAYGTLFGMIGAAILYFMLKKHWIPDFLQNPFTLMVVIGVFAISNTIQHESGLLAVTAMGVLLANQKNVRIKHIIEFKENLQVLLISTLFILLASRLKVEHLGYFNWGTAAFLGALFFVVRPLSIYISSIGSNINFKERTFLAWMAPRGIVAAAISAIFALRLEQEGYAAAEQLVPLTFFVIIATVTIYGLTANPVARWLGVAKPQPRGVLLLGAHNWSRMMADALNNLGYKVLVADSNWENISKARKMGLNTYYGNVLSEYAMDEINIDGIGRLLALTPNDEVNSLSAIRFSELFGTSEVYQLAPSSSAYGRETELTDHLSGRILFSNDMSFAKINDMVDNGAVVKNTPLTPEFTFKDYRNLYREDSLPLFLISQNENVEPFAVDNPPSPQPGDTIVALVTSDFDELRPTQTVNDTEPKPELPD